MRFINTPITIVPSIIKNQAPNRESKVHLSNQLHHEISQIQVKQWRTLSVMAIRFFPIFE